VLLRSPGALADATTALLMVGAALTLTVYSTAGAAAVKPQSSYDIYDGVNVAAARPFLLKKADPNATQAAALAAQFGAGAAASAGDAGRWALEGGDGGAYGAWAALMAGVHVMARTWEVYGFLQGLVLVMMIVR
jgi:hypothetical protein